MSGDEVGPTGRLAGLRYEQLDDDQRAVWDAVTAGPRGPAAELVTDGSLVGPFNALLYTPGIGARAAALGEAIRFGSSLDAALREVAILAVGAHWRAEFEFWAHARIGRSVGLGDDLIEALARGTLPDGVDVAVRTVHRATTDILRHGRLDDQRYRDVVDLLGESQTVELVATIGHYCLISFTLNVFEVPLPDGAEPRWPQA